MKFNLTQETPLEDFFCNLRDPTLETLQQYSRTQVSRTRVTQTPPNKISFPLIKIYPNSVILNC